MSALLEVEDLEVAYGPAKALFGVSFHLEAQRVLAVLGPNGAGKSTLARAITGLVPPAAGHVRFDGRDITGLPAHEIRRLGLSQAPEGRGLFPSLTVLENLQAATRRCRTRAERRAAIEQAFETYPALAQRTKQRAGTLSGGEQQMLSLAIALAHNVRLLIIDELSLGLAPIVVDRVFESVQRIRERGVTIVVIEQFVERALELADDCLILQHGAVSWQGTSAQARADIKTLYLGQNTDGTNDRAGSAPATASLQ